MAVDHDRRDRASGMHRRPGAVYRLPTRLCREHDRRDHHHSNAGIELQLLHELRYARSINSVRPAAASTKSAGAVYSWLIVAYMKCANCWPCPKFAKTVSSAFGPIALPRNSRTRPSTAASPPRSAHALSVAITFSRYRCPDVAIPHRIANYDPLTPNGVVEK